MSAQAVRLHLTNINGVGAIQLVKSLLPALAEAGGYRVEKMFVPARGEMADFASGMNGIAQAEYPRRLPNALSRLLECTLFSGRFDGPVPLFVLGDVPLRVTGPQSVLVHSLLLTSAAATGNRMLDLKFRLYRALFRYNARHVKAFIVQTEQMQASLEASYPEIRGRTHVVRLPAPRWLASETPRKGRASSGPLRLFYPATAYPHKNHGLLARIPGTAGEWPAMKVVLTIDPAANPEPHASWIGCVGRLDVSRMLEEYRAADALLFPSLAESMGFPLVEAMGVGIPIVCADRPYARELCGETAIYFDPGSGASLLAAIHELRRRLETGWWPDWSSRLARIPRGWDEVASEMLRIVTADA